MQIKIKICSPFILLIFFLYFFAPLWQWLPSTNFIFEVNFFGILFPSFPVRNVDDERKKNELTQSESVTL